MNTLTTTLGANMTTYRSHPGMSVFNQNKIVVCGGTGNDYKVLDTCEQYSIIDNTWTSFPSMRVAAASFTMLNLNNKLYTFGGTIGDADKMPINCDNYLNFVFMYDSNSNEWSTQKSLPIIVADHAAIPYDNGALLCGGTDNQCNTLSSCYKYSPSDDTWTLVGNMAMQRTGHQMSFVNRE